MSLQTRCTVSFQSVKVVIDKRLSASSPATLTGLASVPELVGANTADLPNKGEIHLNVHCVTVFLDLRLDSVGLPPSPHNALTLFFRERDQHFH